MFEGLDLGSILTIVLSLVTAFAGAFWLKAKGKLSKIIKLGKEAFDVASSLEKALEDNKITKAEIDVLKKDLKEVKSAWDALKEK